MPFEGSDCEASRPEFHGCTHARRVQDVLPGLLFERSFSGRTGGKHFCRGHLHQLAYHLVDGGAPGTIGATDQHAGSDHDRDLYNAGSDHDRDVYHDHGATDDDHSAIYHDC